jgi:hypothetical protein
MFFSLEERHPTHLVVDLGGLLPLINTENFIPVYKVGQGEKYSDEHKGPASVAKNLLTIDINLILCYFR